VLWSPDGVRFFEYAPPVYDLGAWVAPLWFEGEVQEVISEKIVKEVVINGVHKTIVIDRTPHLRKQLK